jgi:hypothetical protein
MRHMFGTVLLLTVLAPGVQENDKTDRSLIENLHSSRGYDGPRDPMMRAERGMTVHAIEQTAIHSAQRTALTPAAIAAIPPCQSNDDLAWVISELESASLLDSVHKHEIDAKLDGPGVRLYRIQIIKSLAAHLRQQAGAQ